MRNRRRARPQGCLPGCHPPVRRADTAAAAIKATHTLIWLSIEASMAYLLYTGFTRRSDRRAAIAAGVVAGESLIFVADGFRCPLTRLTERLGTAKGSVTDIYLPPWLARNLPAIHVPLIILAVRLHSANLRGKAASARRIVAPSGQGVEEQAQQVAGGVDGAEGAKGREDAEGEDGGGDRA